MTAITKINRDHKRGSLFIEIIWQITNGDNISARV